MEFLWLQRYILCYLEHIMLLLPNPLLCNRLGDTSYWALRQFLSWNLFSNRAPFINGFPYSPNPEPIGTGPCSTMQTLSQPVPVPKRADNLYDSLPHPLAKRVWTIAVCGPDLVYVSLVPGRELSIFMPGMPVQDKQHQLIVSVGLQVIPSCCMSVQTCWFCLATWVSGVFPLRPCSDGSAEQRIWLAPFAGDDRRDWLRRAPCSHNKIFFPLRYTFMYLEEPELQPCCY